MADATPSAAMEDLVRVRFSALFEFSPPEDSRIVIAFKPGTYDGVRRLAAERAVAVGKGVILKAGAGRGKRRRARPADETQESSDAGGTTA